MNTKTASQDVVLSTMSSEGTGTLAHQEETKAAHTAISILSPGREEEEEKNQDRILIETAESKNVKYQFAIVCDGTTASPYADAAADYVAGQLPTLFQKDGLRRTTEALKEMREALLQKPLKLGEGQSPLLRSMFEEIVKQKYLSSYQTTFVAVCLTREENNSAGMISIKAIGCGDSAVFIFLENGELLYNNVHLEDDHDGFKHSSPLTAVLPDCYDEETNNLLFEFKEYPEDVQLLLCSDGLYDGFTNFKELYGWLNQHRSELEGDQREQCLSELHHNLSQTKGDDDISLVWLLPSQPLASRGAAWRGNVDKDTSSESDQHGVLGRLCATIFRSLRIRTL
jgi:serine/threonine protein phosphatase PrpC